MDEKRFTNPEFLLNQQYKTSANLAARIRLHRDYGTGEMGLHEWCFNYLRDLIPPTAKILEIGAGRGDLWSENAERIPAGWDITLTDMSAGMLDDNREFLGDLAERFSYQTANAEELPFEDASFDVVIANMMLYHVPNVHQAIAEIRRVLKDNGKLFAETNGDDHMNEIFELARQADSSISREIFHFRTQTGADDLKQRFSFVRFERYENDLWVTDTQAILDYIGSMSRIAGDHIISEKGAEIRAELDRRMAADGGIRVSKDTGMFIAMGRK